MIRLVTYADANMSISAKRCIDSALKCGVDETMYYTPDHVSHDFKVINKDVWKGGDFRGAGCLWLFKPYVVLNAMNDMSENDYLIYSDAGIEWRNGVKEIISRMDQSIFLFTNTFKQCEWTKGIVMDEILPEWRDGRYDNAMQVQASVIFFRVCQETRAFVKRWLCYCQMPDMLTPADKCETDFKTYAAHREDQSVLCALQIKYGYKLHWYPSTTGHHVHHITPDDNYPELFYHHRMRNSEYL